MMRISVRCVAVVVMCGVCFCAGAVQPISKYGLIQNVQNYSTNPFWSPDSPYNQRMPQPVYVQGADLNTGDCQRTVSALVASYCATRNYCISVSLDDARPAIVTQLSQLPNYNYVSACAGYIDTEFENYKKQNSTAAPRATPTAFPAATEPNAAADNENTFVIENPYAPKVAQNAGDPWGTEMRERREELKNLQSQTSNGDARIAAADFPATVTDLSFTERNELLRAGYESYKGKSAYNTINVEDMKTYSTRKDSYCRYAAQNLATLKRDLETLKKCRANGTKIENCITIGKYL